KIPTPDVVRLVPFAAEPIDRWPANRKMLSRVQMVCLKLRRRRLIGTRIMMEQPKEQLLYLVLLIPR
ncbi:hypothetical protein BV22DRAFT_1029645, partial [Leucogyrophana mollusca]